MRRLHLTGMWKLFAKSRQTCFFSLGFDFKYSKCFGGGFCESFQGCPVAPFYSYVWCTQFDVQGFEPAWAEL